MDNRVGFLCDKKLDYRKEYLFEKDNPVYRAVEKLLVSLKLDEKNAFKKNWNPLGKIIKPGDKVVIKPNLVASRDKEKRLKGKVLQASSTNPSVIRPLIDYAWKAMKKKGKITIVDAPIEGSNFEQTIKDLGLFKMVIFLKNQGVNIRILDLRSFKMTRLMLLDNFVLNNYSFNLGFLVRKNISGDPLGYTVVDLKNNSFLEEESWDYKRFSFHRSMHGEPLKHHGPKKHEYSIANTVLQADVLINIPKLKTHKKAGVTLSLKNLVGIINEKYWLPHYRAGNPPLGDEYPHSPKFKNQFFKRISRVRLPFDHSLIANIVKLKDKDLFISEGAWQGNDTLWRTILDINKIFFFTDRKGKMTKKIQRKCFTLVDGIIAGEGNGPIRPIPKKCGLLIGGFNPCLIDLFTVKIMGFDYHQLKQITQGTKLFSVSRRQIEETLSQSRLNMSFKPPFGWEDLK